MKNFLVLATIFTTLLLSSFAYTHGMSEFEKQIILE